MLEQVTWTVHVTVCTGGYRGCGVSVAWICEVGQVMCKCLLLHVLDKENAEFLLMGPVMETCTDYTC